MMKIAITGGAGFIGSHLVRAYLDAGHDVFVIDNLSSGSRDAVDRRARFYQLDIRDDKLRTILHLERPDLLSHHAAQRESLLPAEESMVNADVQVRGLLNVLASCVSASVGKIVFASGGNNLFGEDTAFELPLNEQTPLCPQHSSAISKAAGEWYVRYYTRQYNLAHTILRYADVYGETDGEQSQHPLSYFAHMLLDDRRSTIRGSVEAVRDHIYIDDVVRANFAALERGKNQTFHISSGHGHTVKQFYQAAARILESDLEPVYISQALQDPAPIIMDNALAQRVLKWRPEVDFTEGVRRTVKLLREQRRPVIYMQKRETEDLLAAVVA